MATRYVDPNASVGGNGTTNGLSGANAAYVSLSVWEAARQGTLSEVENVICSTNGGAVDPTQLTIDGWTTSAVNYINITVDAAYRHAGVWDDAKYRIVDTGGFGATIYNGEPYMRISGLQIQNTHASGSYGILHDPNVNNTSDQSYFDALIVRDTLAGNGCYQADGRAMWRNCVSYGNSQAGFVVAFASNGAPYAEVYNCVGAANGTNGFTSNSNSNFIVARNNYAGGNTGDDYQNTFRTGSNVTESHNASEDATGSSGLTGIAYSTSSGAFFTNITAGSQNFHIGSSSSLKGVGTNLSAIFATDIDGETRSGSWDIGADQRQTLRYVDPAADVGGNGTTLGLTGANAAYVSLNVWEAARQGTLSEPEEVQCAGSTADTTAVFIDGWTTSAANYILVTSHASSRHAGVWNSGIYRLETAASGDFFFYTQENYTRIYALQVSIGHGYAEAVSGDVTLAGIGGVRIERNIVRATIASDAVGIMATHSNTSAVAQNVTANNLVYGFSGTTSGLGIYARSAADRHLCYNNTVYNCRVGLRVRDAQTQIKNNLVIGCTDDYLLTDAAESGSTNNGYDEGTDPAANGIDLSASADGDIFVNAGSADFHLVSGSDAAGVGADLSSDTYFPITEDIDGETRSGAWSIGADHLAVATVTGIIQNMQIG